MTTEVLLIPGLDDVAKYGSFVASCAERNINIQMHVFGWQDRYTPLDVLQNDLLDKIDSYPGIIQVVGVSAGGQAAAWAMQQRPGKVVRAINVCGALKHPRESHLNRFFSHKYEALFDEMLADLKPSPLTDKRLVSLRPLYDGIVRRLCLEFGDSEIIDIPMILHPWAIKYALKYVVPDLLVRDFAR